MKKDSKIWPIVLLIIFLLIIFIFIACEIIKESSKSKDNTPNTPVIKEEKELKQNLTCYTTSNLLTEDEQVTGQKNIRYNFIFKDKKFTKYRKEVFLAFVNSDAFQSYCISCDNIEANDIKSITKGIDINITNAKNLYIYENTDINVLKYDGELKETQFGLDGLTKDATIDDVLFFTKDMICYWEN